MIIYQSIQEGLFISFFSVLIVFSILSVIAISINSLKYIHESPPKPIIPLIKKETPFSINDIKDDDMMVAALVASIDYQEITKKDVFIKSIKEIKERTQ